MLISLIVSFFLIIPSIYGNELVKTEKQTNISTSIAYNAFNKTKLTIPSEGGAIISNTPALSLNNDVNIPAIPLTSGTVSSNKVKARKGAILNMAEDSENLNSDVKNVNITRDDSQHFTTNGISSAGNSSIANNSSTLAPTPTKGHKPTIVSAEAIAKTDELYNNQAVENEQNIKTNKLNPSAHPGMVMPIVITILVVPMFAVIGYMVLKRGREAWKNRHYKRMDFLLDGMYND